MRIRLTALRVLSTLFRRSILPKRTLALLLAALLCGTVTASDGATDQPRIPWTFPVCVPDGQCAEAQALARELSSFLGQNGKVLAAGRETVACFRVEIKTPNPGDDTGFLLTVENTGARLSASNVASLKEAFEYLKSLAVRDAKSVKLAAGTFTTMAPQNAPGVIPRPVPVTLLTPRGDIPELPNFAKVSDALFRGGQPDAGGFRMLKQLGVKTVIDLCASHSDRKLLAGLGLRYVHMSCEAANPEESKAVLFLKILSNPANHPVFVHCHRGADRTGMMAGTYRILEQGWSVDDAIAELPRFKFGEGNKRVFNFLHFDPAELRKKVEQSKSPIVEIIP